MCSPRAVASDFSEVRSKARQWMRQNRLTITLRANGGDILKNRPVARIGDKQLSLLLRIWNPTEEGFSATHDEIASLGEHPLYEALLDLKEAREENERLKAAFQRIDNESRHQDASLGRRMLLRLQSAFLAEVYRRRYHPKSR
jgi:hypothetical protein